MPRKNRRSWWHNRFHWIRPLICKWTMRFHLSSTKFNTLTADLTVLRPSKVEPYRKGAVSSLGYSNQSVRCMSNEPNRWWYPGWCRLTASKMRGKNTRPAMHCTKVNMLPQFQKAQQPHIQRECANWMVTFNKKHRWKKVWKSQNNDLIIDARVALTWPESLNSTIGPFDRAQKNQCRWWIVAAAWAHIRMRARRKSEEFCTCAQCFDSERCKLMSKSDWCSILK